MARYVGHAVDQYGRDIPGAYVTVVGMDGSAATLTDDYGNPISQPLKTDDFGGYYFNTADGLYTITIYRSGLIVTRLYNVVVGDASILPAGSVVNALGTATNIAPSQNAITTGFGAANGAGLIGFKQTTTLARLSSQIYLTDYTYLMSGSDWTAAILQWLADCATQKKSGFAPAGQYAYDGEITIPVGVEIYGAGGLSTFFVKTGPGTWTFSKGVMRDLWIGPLAAVIGGDTSPGLILNGTDRKEITNVWCCYHGGDGVQFQRGNGTIVQIYSRFNGGRGLSCPAETISGDNKYLTGWIECTANGLSGFYIDDSGTSVQTGSQYHLKPLCQSNGTKNVAGDNYDLVFSGTGHNIPHVYQESGVMSYWTKPTLKESYINFGQNSFVNVLEQHDKSNTVIRRVAVGIRSLSNLNTDEIVLQGKAANVGQLDLYQSADRAFNLDAIGSGAAQTLTLGATLSLAKLGLNFGRCVARGGTLAFGNIAIGATAEATITVTGLSEALPANVAAYASPQAAPPANIDQVAVWLTGGTNPTTDPPVIHVRVRNSTGAAVTGLSIAYNVGLVI